MQGYGPNSVEIAWMLMLLVLVPVILAIAAFTVFLYCRVFAKTGHPWALGFLILVPFGQLIVLCVLALTDWPICKQLRACQAPARPPA